MSWFQTLKDLGRFVVQERKFALAPLLIVILLLAIFILLAELPVLTPFIYALF